MYSKLKDCVGKKLIPEIAENQSSSGFGITMTENTEKKVLEQFIFWMEYIANNYFSSLSND